MIMEEGAQGTEGGVSQLVTIRGPSGMQVLYLNHSHACHDGGVDQVGIHQMPRGASTMWGSTRCRGGRRPGGDPPDSEGGVDQVGIHQMPRGASTRWGSTRCRARGASTRWGSTRCRARGASTYNVYSPPGE